MNRSRILSNFRTEFRRKGYSYRQEATALGWIRRFIHEFDFDNASQIQPWHADIFLSKLAGKDLSLDDQLQAKSAVTFLMRFVIKRLPADPAAEPLGAGVVKITA
jgi:hypothetical protein